MSKLAGDHVSVSADNASGTATDISKDVNSVDFPFDVDSHDVAGFGEAVHNYVAGQKNQPITISGLFNAASNRSHDVLKNAEGDTRTLTIAIGQNAAPTTGDPEISGEFLCTKYQVQAGNAGPVTFVSEWLPADETGATWGTQS